MWREEGNLRLGGTQRLCTERGVAPPLGILPERASGMIKRGPTLQQALVWNHQTLPRSVQAATVEAEMSVRVAC
ncbi:hypothetical protein Pmani_024053 [Petrolisthes manimaculis]|uniref:Uncharacterized protein n=1 Tax=Petrolisthes manimaculis TaxID=1843537 RepID=A0AAE1PAZ4_9EUCA|nr:hypothetical protein Pmani_024053 [Petrolisthes manimaculis]